MPKNFVFYNPEHHQKIFSLLEMKAPAAIITATNQKPDQVGALDPFPLVVDGDFNIPSVFCRDEEGRCLLNHLGNTVDLKVYANRIKSYSSNVIAQLGVEAAKKVILTAHIDAYENSPGASDNASGTVVLLILGELLSSYKGTVQIEIAVLNGEDHYSAAGQMDYLHRYGNEISRCIFAINIDDVGYMKGGTSFSFYQCSKALTEQAQAIFIDFEEIVQGPQWFNGDHMIFVQNEVPCIAFTSENMPELMKAITHTEKDIPEIVDPVKLVNLADAISRLVWDLS
jgi:aminopeptidase YwaD